MGTIADPILLTVAYQRNYAALSDDTKPTEDQVLAWTDAAIRDLIVQCLPRRLEAGQMSPGRLDKLVKALKKELVTCSSGTCDLPSTAPMALAYLSILVGTYVDPTTTLYPAGEVNYNALLDASLDANYTPAATDPIYAWADGKLYYLPTTANRVDYHYVELPARMAASDNWPICDSLIPLGIIYVLAEMWDQLSNMKRAQNYRDLYKVQVELLTGHSYQIPESWRR